MRIQSLAVTAIVVLAIFSVIALIIARQRGIDFELTRNARANREARGLQAQETLQGLAAFPKLTVESQPSEGRKKEGKRVVLAVVSRNVLPLFVGRRTSSRPPARPLLEKLENVDVESVSYNSEELPELIAELTVIRSEHREPDLDGDLAALIDNLRRAVGGHSQVIFS